MSLILSIHPHTPQPRSIHKAGDCLLQGKVVAAPWGGQSVLLGLPTAVKAIESVRRKRKKEPEGHWLLIGAGLSDLSAHVRIENTTFKHLKSYLPSDRYVFMVSPATRMAKSLHNKGLDKIAICCPTSPLYTALLGAVDGPLLAYCASPVALPLPEEGDAVLAFDALPVACRLETTALGEAAAESVGPTVIDLTTVPPAVCVQGAGDTADFSV